MILRDAVSKLETFVWILKHISRVSGQLAYVQTRLRQLAYAYW